MSTERYNTFLKEGKYVLKSNVPGPSVVLMAGVHGNEPCGLDAFELLLPELTITKGTVTFLLGNKKALDQKTRVYEENLNRIFRADTELSDAEKRSYEYTRSRELIDDLKQADVLLDIHSVSAPEAEPFAICEPQAYSLVAQLPIATVVSGFDTLHPTGTDAFVNSCGGIGICLECGTHTDDHAADVAVRSVRALLSQLDMLEQPITSQLIPQRFITATSIYHCQDTFTATRVFKNFSEVSADTVIGNDGETAVTAGVDGVVMFVSQSCPPGDEAFVIGMVSQ